MSSDFPDQVHVERIAEALWQRHPAGNAAVMVGAGFSRNAQPRLPHDRRPPTWVELSVHLVNALNPAYPPGTVSERHQRSLQKNQGAGGFLRLAQEFATTFGQGALESILVDAVADDRQEPAELHGFLLELPWSDIFTTNWDTLLERASPKILGRRFDIVRTVGDIPSSIRPRIVKLHGTIPSIKPLIVTEEQYRTYPIKYAPFVNLVQQSMMENVFCLLGFSGDDPNFLAWSGWVRDHLGASAPQIYLVGWLDLASTERRMLESRNVVPVDLARLPQAASWPEARRHFHSLEWFLRSLKGSQPVSPATWPEPSGHTSENGSPYLMPLGIRQGRTSLREYPPRTGDEQVTQVKAIEEIWRNNREVYLGWVVAPRRARERIWGHTLRWLPTVLAALPGMDSSERLRLLYELNWRFEISLTPLFRDIAEEIAKTLDDLCTPEGGYGLTPDLMREQWCWLGFALARLAREDGRSSDAEAWHQRLDEHASENSELAHRLQYERCLLALSRLDYGHLRRLLRNWRIPSNEPLWHARRGGLLVQTGQLEEAATECQRALQETRERLPRDRDDVAALSQEGWIMLAASSFDFYKRIKNWRREELEEDQVPQVQKIEVFSELHRWKELERLEIDPRADLESAWARLSREPPEPLAAREETPEFDPGHRTVRWREPLSKEHDYSVLPALRFIRLCEEAGLPPGGYMTDLTGSILRRAAVWLQKDEPLRTSTILLQVVSYDQDSLFKAFFSRIRIARMESDAVKELHQKLAACLDYAISVLTSEYEEDKTREARAFWLERFRVGMELLSRLAVRSDVLKPEDLVNRGLHYYRMDLVQKHSLLHGPLSNLLSRSLEAMAAVDRAKMIPVLAALPLPGTEHCRAGGRGWPDPLRDLSLIPEMASRMEEPTRWEGAIGGLLGATAKVAPTTRSRAIWRLWRLHGLHLLTGAEQHKLADALWNYPYNRGELPRDTDLPDWMFLVLPEQEKGQAERAFRRRYLERVDGPQIKTHALRALVDAVRLGGLPWTKKDSERTVQALLKWSEADGPRKALIPGHPSRVPEVEDFKEVLPTAVTILVMPFMAQTDTNLAPILELLKLLRHSGYGTEAAVPHLIRLFPEREHEFCDWIRLGLSTQETGEAQRTAQAVAQWVRNVGTMELPPVPEEILLDLALIIGARRACSLRMALEIALRIVAFPAEGAESKRFMSFVCEGLAKLREETAYELAEVESVHRQAEVPVLRRICVLIAKALTGTGYSSEKSVQDWLAEAEADPLPEVRLALDEDPRLLLEVGARSSQSAEEVAGEPVANGGE